MTNNARRQRELHLQLVPGARGRVRQRVQHLQPPAEVRHRFPIGGPHIAALAGPLPVLHGLLGKAGLGSVMRQQFGLRLHRLGVRGQRLGQLRMIALPRARQQRLIGHLLGQGVLEGVGTLRKEARLVEELGGLEVRQAAMQRRLGQLGDGLQQGQGHLGADDRGGLQELLLLWGQPVDACRQYRLYRRRHLDGRQALRQPIGTRLAHQHPALHQGAHALFQEKRIALRALDEHPLERRQAGVWPQQGVEDRLGTRWGQRIEPQLRIVGLAAPAVLVLGAVVDQQQQTGRGQTVNKAIEQGLGLAINPV